MKTLLPKLLKCRLVQAGGLLAIVVAVAASSAWSSAPEARIKLQGAWICQLDNGIRGLVTYAPLDPSGQSAALRVELVWPLEALQSMRIDAVTDEVAEEFVTGKNTSVITGIGYGLAGGRIVLIFVDNSTLTYDSPTRVNIEGTTKAYLATADADNDGYPDPGSEPVGTFPYKAVGNRVVR